MKKRFMDSKSSKHQWRRLAGKGVRARKALEKYHKRLKAIHGTLELEGLDVPPLMKLQSSSDPNEPSKPTGTSFKNHVAPILINKCGRCHVDRASGQFSMSNFTALMNGQRGAKVIFPGDAKGSRLIETIEEGDMPRGGLKVTDEEMKLLTKWIDEGAKFDGEDRNANLKTIVPDSAKPMDLPKASVVASTGKETVSFAMDIAPLIINNCTGCHLDGRRIRGGLNMQSFRNLVRGGDSGAPFVAKNPMSSLLLNRLKGIDGERMPQGRPALKTDEIAKVEKWIAEGATFDGGDAATDIKQVFARAKAIRSSHEELMAERKAASFSNWQLGMPNISNETIETKNFLIIGNVSKEQLQSIGKLAEGSVSTVARTFKAPAKGPLVKGRMTIYVFKQRYDYSEFGKMVEKRDLPREWRGHWKFDIVDAYGAVLPSRSEDFSNEALVGQQVAAVYASSLGVDVPKWFAEGSARVAATRIDKKDPRVASWNDAASDAATRLKNPGDFLEEKMNPEDASLISYKFVEFLMRHRGFPKLVAALKKGHPFGRAFEVIYGDTPSNVAAVWMGKAPKNNRGSKSRR